MRIQADRHFAAIEQRRTPFGPCSEFGEFVTMTGQDQYAEGTTLSSAGWLCSPEGQPRTADGDHRVAPAEAFGQPTPKAAPGRGDHLRARRPGVVRRRLVQAEETGAIRRVR